MNNQGMDEEPASRTGRGMIFNTYGQHFKVGDLIVWYDTGMDREINPETDRLGLIVRHVEGNSGYYVVLEGERLEPYAEQWVYDHYKVLKEEV